MGEITLQSVLDKLIKEDQQEASNLLHKWFIDTCSDIHHKLVEADDTDDEDDEEDDNDKVDENLSPINGYNNTDDDADDQINTSDELGGYGNNVDADDDDIDIEFNDNEDGDDEDLEDRVEGLENELSQLRAQISAALGDDFDGDFDVDVDVDPDDDDDNDDDDSELNLEGSDKTLQFEKIADPHIKPSKVVGDENVRVYHTTPLTGRAAREDGYAEPVAVRTPNLVGDDLELPPAGALGPFYRTKSGLVNAKTRRVREDTKTRHKDHDEEVIEPKTIKNDKRSVKTGTLPKKSK